MPTIIKQRDMNARRRKTEPKKLPADSTIEKKKRYASRLWRQLSTYMRQTQPLCQLCDVEDEVKAARQVHHLIKFDSQPDEETKDAALSDVNNVISLCAECHQEIHSGGRQFTEKQRKWLADKKKEAYASIIAQGYSSAIWTEDDNRK